MFPTRNPVDRVEGVTITAIDAGVCAIIANACEFGITGHESPQQLNDHPDPLKRIESVRLRAALAMGLGDARGVR
ncbi:PrpF domain-containing protein [Mycobacterium sp.]|uniref:PrpF domain-containing protein n=1 Tax=Mycobacterium sp. TaxID=1785 RepID=UPI003F9A6862